MLDARLVKARAARPLLFCGEMCYSLYLVHWPVVTVVSWGVNSLRIESPLLILSLGLSACLLVSLSLSRLFHRLVERRFWNPGYATSREQG